MAAWRESPAAVPERLARYVRAEWAGYSDAEAPAAWMRACWAWRDANPGRRMPFGEHGDHLDVIRERPSVRAVRERNERWRHRQN